MVLSIAAMVFGLDWENLTTIDPTSASYQTQRKPVICNVIL